MEASTLSNPKFLFLFGGGASHGCKGINFDVPLGNQLFHRLKRSYPKTWGQLPPDVSALFIENFEKGMQSVWERDTPRKNNEKSKNTGCF